MQVSDAFKCAARAAVEARQGGVGQQHLGGAKRHAKCAERTLQDAVADVRLPAGRDRQSGSRPALSVHLAARQAGSHSLAMSFGFVALNSLVLTAFSCCESQWLHLHSSASLLLLSLLLLLFSASSSRPFKSFNRGACIVICLQLACPPLFIIRSCVWEDQLPSQAWPGLGWRCLRFNLAQPTADKYFVVYMLSGSLLNVLRHRQSGKRPK